MGSMAGMQSIFGSRLAAALTVNLGRMISLPGLYVRFSVLALFCCLHSSYTQKTKIQELKEKQTTEFWYPSDQEANW